VHGRGRKGHAPQQRPDLDPRGRQRPVALPRPAPGLPPGGTSEGARSCGARETKARGRPYQRGWEGAHVPEIVHPREAGPSHGRGCWKIDGVPPPPEPEPDSLAFAFSGGRMLVGPGLQIPRVAALGGAFRTTAGPIRLGVLGAKPCYAIAMEEGAAPDG